MKIKNFKMKVTPEEWVKVQEFLLYNECFFEKTMNDFYNKNYKPHLYLYNGQILKGENTTIYNDADESIEELSCEEFFIKYDIRAQRKKKLEKLINYD